MMLGMLFAADALAENVLQDISYTPMSGGKVQITMKFAAALAEPRIFTTENPARIAIDVPDTRNGMTQRRIEINTGATSAVSAVEAAGRTRIVVDLFHVSAYDTKTQGNNLVLTVNNGMNGSATVTAVATTDPTKAIAGNGVEVSNVDFRRAKMARGALSSHSVVKALVRIYSVKVTRLRWICTT